MINKTIHGISCQSSAEESSNPSSNLTWNADAIMTSTEILTASVNSTYKLYVENLTRLVCKAEEDSQKEVSVIIGYRSPIAAIFPLIIILFAGGWSDRKGIRKPCMLFPLIGELLGCVCKSNWIFVFIHKELNKISLLLFSSPNSSHLHVPTTHGIRCHSGETFTRYVRRDDSHVDGYLQLLDLCHQRGEQNFQVNYRFKARPRIRVPLISNFVLNRFGCFSVFVSIVPIVATPFAGVLYESLGYISLFPFR